LFLFVRIATALAALIASAATVTLILFDFTVDLMKGSVGFIATVAAMFTSPSQRPGGQHFPATPLTLVALLMVFLAMFASVFTPRLKAFLHIIAAMAAIAGVWSIWTGSVAYVPVLALWFVYYALCFRRI
jgi:hypothetical protein